VNARQSHIRFNIVRGLELEALQELCQTTRDSLIRAEAELELERRKQFKRLLEQRDQANDLERLTAEILRVLNAHSGNGLNASTVASRVLRSVKIVSPLLYDLLERGWIEHGLQQASGAYTFKSLRKD
jgi:molecular chaperone GrpE (heat shock protein)